jgi:hypothetical protein
VAFSSKNYQHSNETDEDIFGNRIIILKRVKSLKQLRRTEKELVRLNYKEAIIMGFTLKGIQQYIATKTKIWVEWSYMEYLKKAEEQENREWYYRLAKDHFAYVGAHRKFIDELEQLKKEMWKIIRDPKAEMHNRVQATKELHSLAKTSALLLRDLPFVTNLSKLYDKDFFDSNYNDSLQSNNEHLYGNLKEIARDYIQRNHYKKPENRDIHFNSNSVNGGKVLVDKSEVKVDKSPNKYKCLDDEVFEDMQRQMHIADNLNGKSIEEITDEDLDSIITPEHKASIKKIEELLDD